jgi:hypothetical protein
MPISQKRLLQLFAVLAAWATLFLAAALVVDRRRDID